MPSRPPARRLLLWPSIASLTIPLAGCATANSSRTACPPLVTYPPDFQRRAAGELQALPPGSAIGRMIVNYGRHRDACRTLEGR